MLVGGGKINITENIKGQVRELQLDSKVIFTGEVDNTYDFYDAIDIFLMPSLFEGLPFTLIEAQTSGLPCLISENVTKEVDLTDLIHRLSLENNAEAWARELENIQLVQDRCKYHDQIVKSSYDIGFTSRRLEKIYTNQTI
jgi:glycosyltransferase involved in cell wall biosynthesis